MPDTDKPTAGGTKPSAADTRFYTVAMVLMVVIIAALATLWWMERRRRVRVEQRPPTTGLEGMLGALGPGGGGEPARRFDVEQDGRIAVRVRQGRYELTLRFSDEAAFREAQPGLFAEYHRLLAELREPEGAATRPTGPPTASAAPGR